MAEKSRLTRNLLIAILAVIVLGAATVLSAPLWLPTNLVSGRIETLVRQKTNRELRIAGPVSLSLWPRVGLVAHDVTLASPAGFTTDFLAVKSVDVALAPLPLLHGVVEIERLMLSGPAVNFEINQAGERNWVFRRPQTTAAAATTPSRRSSAASFVAGDVRLVDGAANFLDQRTGRKGAASAVNLTLSLPSAEGPLKTNGTLIVNGDTVSLAASTASPGALRDGQPSATAIEIASPLGGFGFHGEIAPGGKADGTLSLKTPSLRALLDWLHTGLAPRGSGDAPLSLDAKIDEADGTTTLSDASLTVGDLAGRGSLVVRHTDNRIELELDDFTLSGGKAVGTLTADNSAAPPKFAAKLDLTGITIRQLPIGIAGFGALSGTGNISVDFSASGRTMHDIVGSLDGSGRIDFANGTIGSGGLAPALRNSLGPLVSNKAVPREFAFTALSASATIDHGVLHNDDLKLTGPQATATGDGTLDLAQRGIDYLWQPDIVGLGNARIDITGSWDAPDYKIEQLNITGGGKGFTLPGGIKLR